MNFFSDVTNSRLLEYSAITSFQQPAAMDFLDPHGGVLVIFSAAHISDLPGVDKE